MFCSYIKLSKCQNRLVVVATGLTVSAGVSKVNVPVQDRVMLHLFENNEQADRYLVGPELTRPGIAESCALHPPNVSRTMRELLRKELVSEHTRNVKGEDRRQKTWQLTCLLYTSPSPRDLH